MTLTRRPISLREARRFVGEHHRHSLPPQGGLFAVSVVMEFASSFYDVIAGEGMQDAISTGAAKVRDSYSPLLKEFMRNLDISGIAEEAFGEEPAGKERE